MNFIILIGGFIVLVVSVFFLVRYFARRRRDALNAVAESLQFSFSTEAPDFLVESLRPLHLFSRGRKRKVMNVLSGKRNDVDVKVMDYRFTTGSGKNRKRHSQTLVLFESENLQFPTFFIRPENLFHKIGSAVIGYQDIDFESHPAFSKRYLLRGPDEEAIRNCFSNEFLSSFERLKGMCMECDGNRIVYYRHGRRLPPKQLLSFLDEAIEALELLGNISLRS